MSDKIIQEVEDSVIIPSEEEKYESENQSNDLTEESVVSSALSVDKNFKEAYYKLLDLHKNALKEIVYDSIGKKKCGFILLHDLQGKDHFVEALKHDISVEGLLYDDPIFTIWRNSNSDIKAITVGDKVQFSQEWEEQGYFNHDIKQFIKRHKNRGGSGGRGSSSGRGCGRGGRGSSGRGDNTPYPYVMKLLPGLTREEASYFR
jgi:hypothetical protein